MLVRWGEVEIRIRGGGSPELAVIGARSFGGGVMRRDRYIPKAQNGRSPVLGQILTLHEVVDRTSGRAVREAGHARGGATEGYRHPHAGTL